MTANAEVERYEDHGADDPAAFLPEPLVALLEQVDRGMARLRPRTPLGFRFSWRGIGFDARGETRGAHMMLDLVAEFATIPFSAEDRLARARLHEFLARIGQNQDCPLTLTRHGAIRYHRTVAIELPLTATDVVAATVALLLRVRPYTELVEELRPRAR